MALDAADVLLLSSASLLITSVGFAIGWARARTRASRAEGIIEGMRSVQSPQQQGLRGKLPRSGASITPH